MSSLAFLFDENTPKYWVRQLLREEPGITATRPGWTGAPPVGTTDQQILAFCRDERYAWITIEKRTLYVELANFAAKNGVLPPVFRIRDDLLWQQVLPDLLLIWGASSYDEWIDTPLELPSKW
jgi:hypothetical protein